MRRLFALLGAAVAATCSHAGVVTFDDVDGYTPAISLSGQPGWAGAGGMWNVQTRDGSGNNLAQSANPIGDGPFSNTRFTPDAAFLGGSTAAAGVFNYSFELRNDAASTVDDFNSAHIIRLADDGGDGTAIRFNVLNNGVLQLLGGGSSANVVDGLGDRLDLDDLTGQFITIEGVIDFTTGTYTAAVNGVPQEVAGSTTIGFFEGSQDDFGIVRLQRGGSTSAPSFRQISLDNITFTLVPEPSAALLCLGSLGGVVVRRRSH